MEKAKNQNKESKENKNEDKKEEHSQEQIGFHKGSLATLSKEREELLRIVSITEQLMQAHIKALKELGIDIEKAVKKADEEIKNKKEKENLDKKINKYY